MIFRSTPCEKAQQMRLAVVFAIASENSGSERMLRQRMQTREAQGREGGFGGRRRRIFVKQGHQCRPGN
jgi:hypothetical protein